MFKQINEIGVTCYTYLVLANQWNLPLHQKTLKVSCRDLQVHWLLWGSLNIYFICICLHLSICSLVFEVSCLITESRKHIWPFLTTMGCYKQTHSTCCIHPPYFATSNSDILITAFHFIRKRHSCERCGYCMRAFFFFQFHVSVTVLSFSRKHIYDLVVCSYFIL